MDLDGADGTCDFQNCHISDLDIDTADGDIYYAGTTDDEDFDNARYLFVPALGGIMYESKMSPLPQCVKAVNQSKFNGWFAVQPIYK